MFCKILKLCAQPPQRRKSTVDSVQQVVEVAWAHPRLRMCGYITQESDTLWWTVTVQRAYSAMSIPVVTWSMACVPVCLWLLPSDKLVREVLLFWEGNTVLLPCVIAGKGRLVKYLSMVGQCHLVTSTSCQAPDSHVVQTWLFCILHFTAKFQSPSRSYGLFWISSIAVFSKSTFEVVFSRYQCCLALECT